MSFADNLFQKAKITIFVGVKQAVEISPVEISHVKISPVEISPVKISPVEISHL